MQKYKRILFILKLRSESGGQCYGDGLSSGLFNSARFVVDMLVAAGVEAKLIQVVDNNEIDYWVHLWKPDIAVIEGLWVVPKKFVELIPLHPKVRWIVRIHSEIPFLAMEGIALDWIAQYLDFESVYVSCNSKRAYRDIQSYAYESMLPPAKVLLLPNYYPVTKAWWNQNEHGNGTTLRVGCFGAIRPLKNQLIQAMAAVQFAAQQKKPLRFYMTVRDSEQGGDQVLKNIRALFAHTGNELVERAWCAHDDFLGILDLIDVGMAVSLSESFCIVAADMVNAGVPVVVSPEIRWASRLSMVNPTNMADIVDGLGRVSGGFLGGLSRRSNRIGLAQYSDNSRQIWLNFLKN